MTREEFREELMLRLTISMFPEKYAEIKRACEEMYNVKPKPKS